MRHPFVIFTDDAPWVWGLLYGSGLIVGVLLLAMSNPFGWSLIAGVFGSFVAISFLVRSLLVLV